MDRGPGSIKCNCDELSVKSAKSGKFSRDKGPRDGGNPREMLSKSPPSRRE